MTFSLYRASRSARLTVTVPDGSTVTVENLRNNEGFRLAFEATRTMDENPGEFKVSAWNLPPEALAAINAAQIRSADDLDAMLVDATLGPTRSSGRVLFSGDRLQGRRRHRRRRANRS